MTEHFERVTAASDPAERLIAEARYRLAAGWLEEGDIVIDAACGTGYGADLIGGGSRVSYVGVERDLSVIEVDADHRSFLAADLEVWGGPATDFDVAIVLETLEHLADPTALRDWTYRARRLVIVSVPLMPSVGGNPYHLHDYRPHDIYTLWKNMKPLAFYEHPPGTGIWVFGQW